MTALLTETARDLTMRLNQELTQEEAKHERFKRKVLRTLVPAADFLAGLILKGCKSVHETLAEEGFEGRELARHCEMLLGGIDGCLTAYDQLRGMVAAADLSPGKVGLDELEAKLPALRDARPLIAGLLSLATRPPKPVDEALLAKTTDALKLGEPVILDEDYLSRIQAGEDF